VYNYRMNFNTDGTPNIYWVIDRIRKWWGKYATWESQLDYDYCKKNAHKEGLESFKNKYFKVGYEFGWRAGIIDFVKDGNFAIIGKDRRMWYGDPDNLQDAVNRAEMDCNLYHYRFNDIMWWFKYREHAGD
jgi:hypothetical protein